MSNVESKLVQALPPELWNLTTDYVFPELFQSTKGDASQVPLFLRTGYDAMLARPVLNLRGCQVTGDLLTLFDSHMPHLREVDLTEAELDGKFAILGNRVRQLFPKHPDLLIVLPQFSIPFERVLLPRAITKRCDEIRKEQERVIALRNEHVTALAATATSDKPSAFRRILRLCNRSREEVLAEARTNVIASTDRYMASLKEDLRLSQEFLCPGPDGTLPALAPAVAKIQDIEMAYASYKLAAKYLIVGHSPQSSAEERVEAVCFFRSLHKVLGRVNREEPGNAALSRREHLLLQHEDAVMEAEGVCDRRAATRDLFAEATRGAVKEFEAARQNGTVTEEGYQRLLSMTKNGFVLYIQCYCKVIEESCSSQS